MRRSCLTSKFVCVVLETSMYFSGIGTDSSPGELDSGFNVVAVYEVSWHGPKVIYRFTGIRKWVMRWWKRPFWFSEKIKVTFSLNWSLPYQSWCSQVFISSRKFDASICDWKNKFSFFFWKYHLFHIESFWVDFRCVHRLQFLKVCNQYVIPSKFFPRTMRIRGTIQVRLSFQNDGFLTGPSQRQGNTQPVNKTEWLVL